MSSSVVAEDSVYDVFISYSSKDKHVVDALCHYLEEKQIRCWYAPRNILAGQHYADAIVNAIQNVKIFVVVCSKNSLGSKYVSKETTVAEDSEKIIIPFKIEDCSIVGTGLQLHLSDKQWIDAFPEPNEAFEELTETINALLKREKIVGKPPVIDPPIGHEPKEKIVKIAKFQLWLFFCLLLNVSVFICSCYNVGDRLVLLSIFIVSQSIPYVVLRFLENKNAVVTFAFCLINGMFVIEAFLLTVGIDKILPSIVTFDTAYGAHAGLICSRSSLNISPLMICFAGCLLCSILFLWTLFRSKKILHAAGIKKTFPWVPKSVIAEFSRND